jgi:zinc protease
LSASPQQPTAAGAAGLTEAAAPLEVPASLFNPQTFTLDNGMEAIVVTNRRAPVVAHWVWYRVGTADSPVGKSGLPHFLEHLMFKGTERIPPGEFSKIVARHGGNDNAVTSYDFTAYFQMIAKDRLPLVMEMEADRMANLRLSDAEVYPERDVILEERRQRVENEPASILGEQIAAAQWLHHPYRLPVIGWMHEIAAYTREDCERFYDQWYAPGNAVLIVVGDVDAEELRPLAEATYGKIPARELAPRSRVQEPPQHAERRIEMRDPRVRQPSLSRSWLAPSLTSAEGGGHAYPLEVLAQVLGNGGTSRLYRSLVVEQGLAAGAGAYYRGTARYETSFRVYASPRPGVGLDRLEAALEAEVGRVLRDGVTDEEVARVKRRMLAETIYALDSLNGAAHVFGAALCAGLAVADVEAWPARVAAVTREQVDAAARHVLRPERSVVGRLEPLAEEADPAAAEAAA